jgi:hypothetical protein
MSCHDKCTNGWGVDFIFKVEYNSNIDCDLKEGSKHIVKVENRQPFSIDVKGGGKSKSQNLQFEQNGTIVGWDWSESFFIPSSPRNKSPVERTENAEVLKTDNASGTEKILSEANYQYNAPWPTSQHTIHANLDVNA